MDVKQIRDATGYTQVKFAELYRIPVSTLRQWEQCVREPTGPALALLKLINLEPDVIAEILAR
jgi:putative transcriptional regulator